MVTKGKEANLVDGGAVEEEDGVGELDFDDVVPEPLHGRTVGDVGRVGRPSTAGELGDEVVVGAADGSSRVTASRKRTRVVVVRVHRRLDRVKVAEEAVAAFVGFETVETTDGGERRVAALDDESGGVAHNVLAVWLLDLGGGENDLEQVEAILWVIELGGRIVARVQETHKLAGFNLGA